jgi:hypothetical protein
VTCPLCDDDHPLGGNCKVPGCPYVPQRTRLPDRRGSHTLKVDHTLNDGTPVHLLVTVDDTQHEVFCASLKVGSDMNAIVSDVCVLLSLLLQMGATPRRIVEAMSTPPSLVGTLARTVFAESLPEGTPLGGDPP